MNDKEAEQIADSTRQEYCLEEAKEADKKKPIDDGGPAFPCIIRPGEFFDITVGDSKVRIGPIAPGLSKRECFAGLAMQALLAQPERIQRAAKAAQIENQYDAIAIMALDQADALLAALKGGG